MRTRLVLTIIIVLFTTITIAQDEDTVKLVCLVPNNAGLEDGTFNQDALDGVIAIVEDYALREGETQTLLPETEADFVPTIQQCIDEGYSTVVTVGFQLAEATLNAAQENPEVYFIGVDHFVADGPENYVGIQFRDDEAGFIVGYMAGLVTESGKVAGIYGPPFPPLLRWRNGFEQGVAYAAAERGEDIRAFGRHMNDFESPDAGAVMAEFFINAGADVVFGAGGITGSGAILHAASEGVNIIGVDQDEYFTTFQAGTVDGAEHLITSALKRVNVGVYDMLAMILEENFDEFPGGSIYTLSVSNGGISFAGPHDSDLDQAIIDKVVEVETLLESGELETGVDPNTGELLASE